MPRECIRQRIKLCFRFIISEFRDDFKENEIIQMISAEINNEHLEEARKE